MKLTLAAISERQRAYFYIYKKAKKNAKLIYIYINPDTLQKSRQFPFRLYLEKARRFTLRGFS